MTLSSQQGGSRVIFGNLLTLPVNDGLLYVEPFYIQGQASSTSFPQLNRVLVWYAGRVGVGQTLTQALTRAAQSAPVQTPALRRRRHRCRRGTATHDDDAADDDGRAATGRPGGCVGRDGLGGQRARRREGVG